jgi:hypothetical protein
VYRFYENMPFYIRDLSILRLWISRDDSCVCVCVCVCVLKEECRGLESDAANCRNKNQDSYLGSLPKWQNQTQPVPGIRERNKISTKAFQSVHSPEIQV